MVVANVLLLTLLACSLFPEGDSADPACAHDPPLSYDTFGKGLMNKYCVGCHSSLLPAEMREGAPVGVDFDTYRGVLTWAERIEVRSTGEAPDMPPGGGPTADELALLREWLHCGVADDLAQIQ